MCCLEVLPGGEGGGDAGHSLSGSPSALVLCADVRGPAACGA
jgi:hypothetical protein